MVVGSDLETEQGVLVYQKVGICWKEIVSLKPDQITATFWLFPSLAPVDHAQGVCLEEGVRGSGAQVVIPVSPLVWLLLI